MTDPEAPATASGGDLPTVAVASAGDLPTAAVASAGDLPTAAVASAGDLPTAAEENQGDPTGSLPAPASAVPETSPAGRGMPGALPKTVPGPTPGTVARKKYRPRIDYELIACGFHGHELAGVGANEVRLEDADIVRENDGVRWHRCLRCDAWIPFEIVPVQDVSHPPALDEIDMPMRGRRLRDRYVLRLIVLDRVIHALVVGLLAFAIFAFARHKSDLHQVYEKIVSVLNASAGSWWVHELNKLFSVSTGKLYLLGAAAVAYAAILVIEAVGLWGAKRWAEYLTLFEVGVFIPYEVYELAKSVTAFKIIAMIVNLAIVLYLLLVHRLFGVRGGAKAALAVYGETD
ncbi:MAG TPA: DUF2127 domain-containing protein [Acidimicrobiales bacterium]|nr:DUF2127 domain-containing protein [Acidimicrobiales bacterium]